MSTVYCKTPVFLDHTTIKITLTVTDIATFIVTVTGNIPIIDASNIYGRDVLKATETG